MRENKKEMPKGLQKSLLVCISKLRKSSSQLQPPSNPPKNWLLSASKYTRTPSFAVDCHKSNGHDGATALADNFCSLYADEGYDSNDNNKVPQSKCVHLTFFHVPRWIQFRGQFEQIYRPFDDMVEAVPITSVAVVTITMDPYDEFRRFMQEMVMAHQMDQCQPLDWDFLEELLFCYLNLNEKRAHKYILGAFVDMMVG